MSSNVHMPLTLAGNWKVFQAQCVSKLPPNPDAEQLESIFYAGATVMLSIMKRLPHMDATEEEGAQLLGRLEDEILTRTLQQLAKALRETPDSNG